MSGERRAWLDVCPGERRGVVTLDGRPEHLLIERTGEPSLPRVGERWRARLGERSPDRREAFLDLGAGRQGVLRLSPDQPWSQGALIEVEVVAEPQAGKSARCALTSPVAEGAIGLAAPGPSLEASLARLAGSGAPTVGPAAREAADIAEEAALAPLHALKGGVTLAIETTRAMTVIDVDLRTSGERGGKTLDANRRAVRHAARLLRLKALGGTCAIDLIGFPSTPGQIMAEAKQAFEPDGAGVAILQPNRLGVLMLARPRGRRPVHEVLLGADGRPNPRTLAQRLVRALEREGRADPGALLRAVCSPRVAVELGQLAAQLGPRFAVEAAAGADLEEAHIQRR